MSASPFVADIRGQALALRQAIDGDPARAVAGIAAADYDRIVLSGMGASLFALYPAWLALVRGGAPAWWLDASELLHDAQSLLNGRTLLLLASQSGRSAEVTALLDALGERRPACIIGITNDPESPLARAADRVVPLSAGAEHAVSTRSYINTLAVAQIVAAALLGLDAAVTRLRRSAEALERYLGAACASHAAAIGEVMAGAERVVIVGRGAALATAWQGALVLKEAAKVAAEGLSAAQFRHGPLELADGRLTAVVLAGAEDTAALNRRLATDLAGYGARVAWLGPRPPVGIAVLPAPEGAEIVREVVDIVPLEIASIALAEAGGFVPGEFRHSGKITKSL